jgi:alpha-galactosidase
MVYTLPTAVAASAKPVKVFILAGQSNMVGHGKVETGGNPKYDPNGSKGNDNPREIPAGLGSLRAMVSENQAKFGPTGSTPLVDASGKWLVRKDVMIYSYFDKHIKKGGLSIGFAPGGWIGPEFGFGHAVGNALSDDVLIIKVATGGTSLAVDWRSPGAVKARGGVVGPRYTHMVTTVKDVLDNLGREFPEFAGRNYEIAGFGWHQGWNDGCDTKMAGEYEANMAEFIRDVRKEFNPNMRFVIANSGFYGDKQKGNRSIVREAQDAMANAEKYPEFRDNVAVVDTRPMWRDKSISPSNFDYHWNHNGITHYLMGEGMGQEMVKLMSHP